MNNITEEELLEAFISWNKDIRANPEPYLNPAQVLEMDIIELSTLQANHILNNIKIQRKDEKSSL